VLFVGEGPGFNEDRLGRPFVGRAGDKLTEWIQSIGWRRQDVFITNIVKCRPPDNRDPLPDEIAACTPFLRRQIEALDPAVVVTLGRFSMGWFTPGTRISQVHGTARLADPLTGVPDATAYAMYHPAAALRSPEVDRQAADDMVGVPMTLIAARERRARTQAEAATMLSAVESAAAVFEAPEAEPRAEAELSPPMTIDLPASTTAEVGTTAGAEAEAGATIGAEPESAPAPTATSSASFAGTPSTTAQAGAGRPTQSETAVPGRLPSAPNGADRPSVPSSMPPAAQRPGPRADDVPSDQLTLF
jgi:DNA polymerase